MAENEIEPVALTFQETFGGIIRQIEWRRLQHICRHFGIEITKENFAYCFSIKVTYDGFLSELYKLENHDVRISDPEGKAYELTAAALRLFKNNKLPSIALPENPQPKQDGD